MDMKYIYMSGTNIYLYHNLILAQYTSWTHTISRVHGSKMSNAFYHIVNI
jgi:hypothetical protein